jgi:muramoyltetrapeptide carboxypeptidase
MGIGGWGSARVLPHLDYDLIRANPKAIAGFSDVTALLNGVHARTGLVTFHGPHPRVKVSADYFRRVLFDGELVTFRNPSEIADDELVQTRERYATIHPGKARGRLLGGNLAVLSAIVGSRFMPDLDGAILFLEDVREAVYRVDRMMTQLRLAGLLDGLAGFVFGRCTDCDPGTSYGSLTLEEVLDDHIKPLAIPAYRGAMIGHIKRQFTLPLGVEAEIDADTGSLRLLEPAVI